jgi:hypothetical protein
VNKYRKLKEKYLLKEALSIYESFLKEDSLFHLNVTNRKRQLVEEFLFDKKTAMVDIFNEIEFEIEWAMDDHIKKFFWQEKGVSLPSPIKPRTSFGKKTLSNLVVSFRTKCQLNNDLIEHDHIGECLEDE